ncbi:hypothetical protein BVRB_3g054010 [Beta vulgaris subsp. vulgaris]|uniref:jasmonate-induced protein homolog n=2 Tax=Beta vulgaris subsp. vulgaris TaxID=3555 RepID=UPI00053FFA67|nr:jasmonate-induced protein homolog [Beta vulgaris subsp. vulgaris]XP_048496903.2 jasmonate-induced protein homolog [Beta vulgaris subsp. vulgaris]KMT16247.1 hypothetical protein BVRB_3g054010 [Beta vulgaris subsp. vulgaris]
MASEQAIVKNDYQQEQEKDVKKMVQEAKSIGAKGRNSLNAAVQAQDSTVVSMQNNNSGMMSFSQSYDWNGKVTGTGYPPAIPSKGSLSFTHNGPPNDGSQGAVVYTGTSANGNACGWLLAWIAPTNITATTPNRVYIECGSVNNYATIDWSAIKAKLDVAPSSNYTMDPITRSSISAEITGNGGYAALGATFGSM